jgi:hypothetical protein
VKDNGWTEFALDHDTVKTLATKRADKIAQGDALLGSGNVDLIEYSERPGNPNPNGGFYPPSRYWENAVGGQTPRPPDQQNRQEPLLPRRDAVADRIYVGEAKEYVARTLQFYPETQRSIEEQMMMICFWSKAFELLSENLAMPLSELTQLAARLKPIMPKEPAPMPAPQPQPVTPAGWDEYGTPPPSDDDIPFMPTINEMGY